MIAKRIDCKPENENYRRLALYAADAKTGQPRGTTEKVLASWLAGCQSDEPEDYEIGILEAEFTQGMNTRTAKTKTFHLMVSFRPEDETKLTTEVLREIELAFAQGLGYEGHQRHIGVHKNTDNLHMHVAYNMINPATFKRHKIFRDFKKLAEVCRAMEKKYGLVVDRGGRERADGEPEKPRTNVKAQTLEAHSGQESFYSYVVQRKDRILEARENSASWREFRTALLKMGLELKPRGNGLTLKDRAGKNQAKPSDLDRSLSRASLEARWGAFEENPDLPAQIPAEESYDARPLHLGPERDRLFERYQAEIAEKRKLLEEARRRETEAFNAHRETLQQKMTHLKKYPMYRHHRDRLIEQWKAREGEILAETRQKLAEERQAIREARPYTSWIKFLQHEAGQSGNEVALAILRSKKMEVQPEDPAAGAADTEQVAEARPLQDEFQARRQALIQVHGLSDRLRRALLTVTAMDGLLAKASQPPLKHRIDGKGTVIFTLPDGGTIRDSGREIHFSPRSPAAGELAEKFAAARWGRRFEAQGNTLKLVSPEKAKEARLETVQPEDLNERIYLTVPFEDKAAAREAGARWERETNQWFAPVGVDLDKLVAWLPAEEPEPATEKIYLDVPFDDKAAAREAGARWEQETKRWFAPVGADLTKFADWLPKEGQELATEKTYLTVPFSDKEIVRTAGARWEQETKRWFARAGADLAKFADWLPKEGQELATEKTYLAVPFSDKEAAREAGARWEQESKRWFAPAGADLSKLVAWIPEKETEKESGAAPVASSSEKSLER